MTRARPLPPEERRAAIIAAARPLVLQYGTQLTTRQVAEAAGVAEGTLFRVFDTKEELLRAVIRDALDPGVTCRRLEAIRPDGGLDDVVFQVMETLTHGVREISAVFAAMHRRPESAGPQSGGDADRHAKLRAVLPPQGGPEGARALADRLLASVVTALRPFEQDLSLPLEQAASLVRSTALAVQHPFFSDQRIDDLHLVSRTLLHGLAASATDPPPASPDDTTTRPTAT